MYRRRDLLQQQAGVGKEPIASGQTVRTKMIVFSLKAVLRKEKCNKDVCFEKGAKVKNDLSKES